MTFRFTRRFIGSSLAFALVAGAMGQESGDALDPGAAAPPPQSSSSSSQQTGAPDSGVRWSFSGGGGYIFRTDIDGGGDFTRTSLGIDGRMTAPISRDFSISLRLQYEFDYYDFRDVGRLGARWNSIHTITAGVFFNWDIQSDVTIFAGPLFQVAAENGADWGDATKWGGAGGIIWAPGSDFRIGIGVGALTQPEDDARFYPIFILDWYIASNLRLSSVAAPSLQAELTGIELVWEFAQEFELAGGVSYYWTRFRLDDDGPVPNGVGQDQGIPIYLRLSWEPSARSELSLYAGVLVAGELKADNSSGRRVGKEDYDATPFIGLGGSFSF